MRHVDFSPLYRSTVGFDRLFTMLDSLGQPEQARARVAVLRQRGQRADLDKAEAEMRHHMRDAGILDGSVVLVDRRGAGEETSFGNAGLIQREGVVPYGFPQQLGMLIRYGFNNRIDAHYHASAMMKLVPFLSRYWWHSNKNRHQVIARAYAPLIENSITEHQDLIQAASAAGGLGIAVLSRHALVADPAQEGLALLPVQGFPIHAHWYIVRLRGKQLSPIARAFEHHLLRQALGRGPGPEDG